MREELLWLFPWFLNTDSRSLPSCCLPDSHGCAFADSGEHHEFEGSPEGAWGTASHHGRADLQFRHGRSIPPPPQSWSNQWKLASVNRKVQVSSRMLVRWSVVSWRFACRNGSSQIQLMKCMRVSLLSFAFFCQCEWVIWAIRGQGESLEMGVSASWTHRSLVLQVVGAFSKAFSPSGKLVYAFGCSDEGSEGQCLEASYKLPCKRCLGSWTFSLGREQEKLWAVTLLLWCWCRSQGELSDFLSVWWCHCSELALGVLHFLCYVGWLALESDNCLQTSWSNVYKASETEVNIWSKWSAVSSGRRYICLKELNKTGLSTEKKKVGMLCKSVCIYYLCNSNIVLKAESPVCHAALKFLFYFIVFWLWPAFACCVAAEHGPALFTPNSKLLVERVEIWIFSLAIHCFSEKKLPLLQILGCNQRAACCSNPLPREEGRKHVSAAGLTRISWLIQDFG